MTSQELIEFRQSIKLKNQTELAKMLGVVQQRVSDWESGKRKIPLYIEKHIECLKKTLRKSV